MASSVNDQLNRSVSASSTPPPSYWTAIPDVGESIFGYLEGHELHCIDRVSVVFRQANEATFKQEFEQAACNKDGILFETVFKRYSHQPWGGTYASWVAQQSVDFGKRVCREVNQRSGASIGDNQTYRVIEKLTREAAQVLIAFFDAIAVQIPDAKAFRDQIKEQKPERVALCMREWMKQSENQELLNKIETLDLTRLACVPPEIVLLQGLEPVIRVKALLMAADKGRFYTAQKIMAHIDTDDFREALGSDFWIANAWSHTIVNAAQKGYFPCLKLLDETDLINKEEMMKIYNEAREDVIKEWALSLLQTKYQVTLKSALEDAAFGEGLLPDEAMELVLNSQFMGLPVRERGRYIFDIIKKSFEESTSIGRGNGFFETCVKYLSFEQVDQLLRYGEGDQQQRHSLSTQIWMQEQTIKIEQTFRAYCEETFLDRARESFSSFSPRLDTAQQQKIADYVRYFQSSRFQRLSDEKKGTQIFHVLKKIISWRNFPAFRSCLKIGSAYLSFKQLEKLDHRLESLKVPRGLFG